MATDRDIDALVGTSMDNLRKMINVSTVVGEAMHLGNGVSVVPISKVSVGFGAGGGEYALAKQPADSMPFGGGSGAGMCVQPIGFLVANNGDVRFMPVTSDNGAVDSIINAVPDIIGFFSDIFGKKNKTEDSAVVNPEDTAEEE